MTGPDAADSFPDAGTLPGPLNRPLFRGIGRFSSLPCSAHVPQDEHNTKATPRQLTTPRKSGPEQGTNVPAATVFARARLQRGVRRFEPVTAHDANDYVKVHSSPTSSVPTYVVTADPTEIPERAQKIAEQCGEETRSG